MLLARIVGLVAVGCLLARADVDVAHLGEASCALLGASIGLNLGDAKSSTPIDGLKRQLEALQKK